MNPARLIPVVLAAMCVGAYFAVLTIDAEAGQDAGLGLLVGLVALLAGQSWINARAR